MIGAAFGVGHAADLWRSFRRPESYARQPGFEGTHMGQHRFIRTERYQDTPPSDLGRTAVYDESFATRAGDYGPRGDWRAEGPAGLWNPLWAEPDMIRGRHQQQYEWDFLTSHGAVEDVLLHRSNLSRAIPARPYTIPTEKPPCTEGLQNRGRLFLK